jgi:hypothetical protein
MPKPYVTNTSRLVRRRVFMCNHASPIARAMPKGMERCSDPGYCSHYEYHTHKADCDNGCDCFPDQKCVEHRFNSSSEN